MFIQILIGTALIVFTVIVAAAAMGLSLEIMDQSRGWLGRGRIHSKNTLAIAALALWLVAIMTVIVWIWTVAFLVLGVFDDFEEALYFSIVSFTTLGFGDIILSEDWRLLSGFIAMDGFILFGLGTAFMFDVLTGLRSNLAEARARQKLEGYSED